MWVEVGRTGKREIQTGVGGTEGRTGKTGIQTVVEMSRTSKTEIQTVVEVGRTGSDKGSDWGKSCWN